MIALTHPEPDHHSTITALLDRVFGTERHVKTSYRLRDGVAPLKALSRIALDGTRVVGSVQYWPVWITAPAGEQRSALLLGPLAVDPAMRGLGIGAALVDDTLNSAQALGHVTVLLVGDEPYYQRYGFSAACTAGLSLPGPWDPARLLSRHLGTGPAVPLRGAVEPFALTALPPPGQAEQADRDDQREPSRHRRRLRYA